MPDSIGDVLSQLDSWYNELPGGNERPRLLSKLAVLELCGWIEERFDGLASDMARAADVLEAPTVQESIAATHGFRYANHVRGIFLSIGGEVLLQNAERRLETKHPGELERMRNMLGDLWKQRCELAHGSSVAGVRRQVSVRAPSWTINQQRILAKLIDKFECELRNSIGAQ